jgi:SpoVK/Ycf46/Vps4 family AAA+-type ATPase
MHAPLYKMELGQLPDEDDESRSHAEEHEIETAFDLASKWKAVLLIDECDLYLEKRSDASPKRNRIVSRMSTAFGAYRASFN